MIENGMPDCPRQCGGPRIPSKLITEELRGHRERWGCSHEVPRGSELYGITCPRCNGAGCSPGSIEEGEPECVRGQRPMRRCPGSMQTPDVSRALRAWSMLRDHGIPPVAGGSQDQAASFVQFCAVLDDEIAFIRSEQERKG